MLRITGNDSGDGVTTLKLEGSITGPWVEELRKAAESLMAQKSALKLDLSAVRFADPAGAELLQELRRENIEITASSQFIDELLHGGTR